MSEFLSKIFEPDSPSENEDLDLVEKAQTGDKRAFEKLIKKHQSWIYNLTLRILADPDEAEDITQEILIKMITKLSTFEKKSKFTTWLYRIVINHALNAKRNVWERYFFSFSKLEKFSEKLGESDINETPYNELEKSILTEETKRMCLTGMLLCLERKQRVVFILGAIFGINAKTGAELLDISPANFKKILSRTRHKLGNFMMNNCGLVNENNSCRCPAKTRACIEKGIIDPLNLRFKREHLLKIRDFVHRVDSALNDELTGKMMEAFRDQVMYESADYSAVINRLLKREKFNQFINFN